MAYLYRHIRIDKNEPFYIGIGSDNNYNRANSKYGRNKLWNSIIKKSDYIIEIILDNLEWKDACNKEIEFISLYGRKDNNTGILVNLTNGGEGTLGVVVSKETLRKRSIKLSGVNNPQYGKTFSKEYREKLSKAKIGKKRNPEVMKKLHQKLRKKVKDYNTGIMYDSLNDLAIAYSVHNSTVGRWLKNKSSQFKLMI